MVNVEDLFVQCYVVVDDLIRAQLVRIPARPSPAPGCSDAEVITIDLVRHLLGRRSESRFLTEILTNHPGLFPVLPHHSEFNRWVRWLWGAFEQIRAAIAGLVPPDDWGQLDTTALPVKHPSRVRAADGWVGPNGLVARFGRDAAHGEWFYGFRLAVRTDLGSRLIRSWSIVPAAVNERDLIPDLIDGCGPGLIGLLTDKGFASAQVSTTLAEQGITLLVPPTKNQRATMAPALQAVIATWRNRIETTFAELTDQMELARHGAHTLWGLLTRTASTIAAHTLRTAILTGD